MIGKGELVAGQDKPGGRRHGHFRALRNGVTSDLAVHYFMVSKIFFLIFFLLAQGKGDAHTHWVASLPKHERSLGGVASAVVGETRVIEQHVFSEAGSEDH